jgi:peptidylprolyl isomerase
MFKRVILMLGVLAMMLLVSCAKAPEEAIQKATAALEAAKTAEADVYAPDAFKQVSDTLAAANAAKQEADGKFALTRSYAKATALLASAELLANKAIEEATAKKAAAQNEASLLIAQVKAVLDTALLEIGKIKATAANKPNLELAKLVMAKAESTYADAQREIESGKFMKALTKLNQLAKDIPATITSAKGTTEMEKAGNPIVVIQTNMGDITLEVFEKETPIHAKNFLDRVDNKLYNGIIFHRVVKGFVIQGGDPTGTGMGAPNEPKLADEVSPFSNIRPYVTMARSGAGASASQFYINLKDNSFLDKQKFSPFAKVIDGMDVVDKIANVAVNNQQETKPIEPVTMLKVFRKK